MSLDVLVTGARGKTGREVVAQLLQVPGVTVRAGSSGPPEPPSGEALDGLDPWLSTVLRGIYDRVRHGDVGRVSPTVETITGRPPRAVEQFVTEHAELWRG